MDHPLIVLAPTSAGLRVIVNGTEYYAPRSAEQLSWYAARFSEATAERIALDKEADQAGRPRVGKWCPKATAALR